MKPTFETIDYQCDAGIAIVTLNRPAALNALSFRMMEELARVFFEVVRGDDAAKVVILTGAGTRSFCAGADIKERAAARPTGVQTFEALRSTVELFNGIESFERPVIAAINGYAMGGGMELALCCDLRLAVPDARLGLPEVRLGALPAAGGTQRLARLIGEARAKEMLFTSEPIDADTALRAGLVNRVVPADELMRSARSLAQRIAAQPPLAVRFAKRAVHMGLQGGMEAGLEFERYAASMLMDTEDRLEGMRAFVEKRDPVFKGR